MGIVLTLFIGLAVGLLARFFMPGRDPGGILITIVLGVAGALVAGFLGRVFGLYPEPFGGPGLIASVLGAMLLLLLYRLLSARGVARG